MECEQCENSVRNGVRTLWTYGEDRVRNSVRTSETNNAKDST